MVEIDKYYDDRWTNDHFHHHSHRRSSNEDEGVEEDFSSSGSGVESNAVTSHNNHDFEELTQLMKNSLTGFDTHPQNERRPSASANMSKTIC